MWKPKNLKKVFKTAIILFWRNEREAEMVGGGTRRKETSGKTLNPKWWRNGREERAVKCVNSIDPQNLMLVDYATHLFSLLFFTLH